MPGAYAEPGAAAAQARSNLAALGQPVCTSRGASGSNSGDVLVDTTSTPVAAAAVFVTAGQSVIVTASVTFQNTSEGQSTPSTLTLFVDDDDSGGSEDQTDEFRSGDTWRNMSVSWRRTGLPSGVHSFALKATSSSGTGDTKVPAGAATITLQTADG